MPRSRAAAPSEPARRYAAMISRHLALGRPAFGRRNRHSTVDFPMLNAAAIARIDCPSARSAAIVALLTACVMLPLDPMGTGGFEDLSRPL